MNNNDEICKNGIPAGTQSTVNTGEALTCDNNDIIHISGQLIVKSNTRVRAAGMFVDATGTLTIGTPEEPVRDVHIYLNHQPCTDINSDACKRQGALWSEGTLDIHGTPKTPWTLLQTDAPAGSSTLQVSACDNWSVGDRVVVSATGGDRQWRPGHLWRPPSLL